MTAETLLPYIAQNHEPELPFIQDLAAPLHAECLLDVKRPLKKTEVSLLDGYHLEVAMPTSPALEVVLADFGCFMQQAMGATRRGAGYPLVIQLGPLKDCPADAGEAYAIQTGRDGCRVTARDVDGVRRALIFLEDEMALRRFPALPLTAVTRWAEVKVRISRSPYASYRFGTGWELDKEEDAYPDEYLNRLAHCGVNGIWVAGILRELVASRVLPEMTVKETKLGLLKRLVEKADLYGIKVYFFGIEPRIQDTRDPVFEAHPEIRGSRWGNFGQTLCTSHPLVLEYIEDATAELFRSAPGLGGFINLFRGERTTACCSAPPPITKRPAGYVQPCPRCSQREMWEIYCDELSAIHRGMRSVSADGKLIAWNYGHGQQRLNLQILEHLDPDIVLLDTFEHDGRKKIWGKIRTIDEYALSYVGPSPPFRALQRCAVTHGKQLMAKMQLGHTFETPSMPYVPVPTSPYRKYKQMHKLGIQGVMQSWIIGGFPSIMHKAAGEAAFLPLAAETPFLKRLAAIEWGERQATAVTKAWKHFFKAFQLYPFSKPVFLYGPLAKSPAYQLYLDPQGNVAKPYNWGIGRDRSIQPYDDNLDSWLGCLTAEQLFTSFREMATAWEPGLEILRQVTESVGAPERHRPALAVAEALGIQFRSCANVLEFYALRDALPEKGREAAYTKMRTLAEDDIQLALQMKPLIETESSIGFQAEMQCYSFSPALIDQKIAQVRQMLQDLEERLTHE